MLVHYEGLKPTEEMGYELIGWFTDQAHALASG